MRSHAPSIHLASSSRCQRGKQRARPDGEGAARQRLDAARHAGAGQITRGEGLQDQQVQRDVDDNVVMDDKRQDRVARMTVRRYSSSRAADADDLAYWRQMSDAERVLQTWRLSVELWRLKGELPDEPGLCRSVARVHRR
jgi:hypothetical protein